MKSILYLLAISLLLFTSCQPQISEEKAKEIMDEVKEISLIYDEDSGKVDMTKNFLFIFDQSGSMGESCSGEQKIDGAKTAITKFMESVPGDVNVGLMVIGCDDDDQIEQLLPLSLATPNQKKSFNDYIMGTEPSQGTPLVTAIKMAVDKMVLQKKLQLGYGEYRIIVVTDGQATDGDITEAAIYSMQYAIGIYTIGLCMVGEHTLKQFSVQYHDAGDYEKLKTALKSVTAETEMFDAANYDSTAYK